MNAPVWRRSSRCESSACVEVTEHGVHVFVRDSRNPRMVLRVDRADWAAFVAGAKAGEFDELPGVD